MSRREPARAAAGTGKDAMSGKSKADKHGSDKPGSNKPGTFGSRAVSGIAGAAAAFAARKLITFGWTKIIGREPPEHPEDPQVSLREALGWALVLGAGVQAARLLATRMASGHNPALPAGTAAQGRAGGADSAD
jgi:hypothetical protein